MTAPLVSVVIPARNEERDIRDCLIAVLAQDYPLDQVEVIVVDGVSSDGTRRVAENVLAGSDVGHWCVIENPRRTTPTSLNLALAKAGGEFLCRVDARSRPDPRYVARCVELLSSRAGLAVVGGAQIALPRGAGPMQVGIARALNNGFAMGGSRYRRGTASGPTDTVYLGAFRTKELRDEGGWDDRFETNQDYELNRRMGQRGLVWYDEALRVGYLPREDLASLWRQYNRFGRWKARYWRTTGDPPRARQVVLLMTPVLSAAVGLLLVMRRSWMRALVAAVPATLVIEGLGTTGPATRVPGRLCGAVAIATTSVGWVHGAWMELLRGTRA